MRHQHTLEHGDAVQLLFPNRRGQAILWRDEFAFGGGVGQRLRAVPEEGMMFREKRLERSVWLVGITGGGHGGHAFAATSRTAEESVWHGDHFRRGRQVVKVHSRLRHALAQLGGGGRLVGGWELKPGPWLTPAVQLGERFMPRGQNGKGV